MAPKTKGTPGPYALFTKQMWEEERVKMQELLKEGGIQATGRYIGQLWAKSDQNPKNH